MRLRHEAARHLAAPPPGQRVWIVAAGLAAYAMLAPLAVAALAGPLPLRGFGTLALATSLLGPGLAMILVCWRGLGAIVQDLGSYPGEPQQAVLRIFATAAALAYVGALALMGMEPDRLQPLIAIDVAAGLVAWLVLLHVAMAPGAHARRGVTLACDVLFLSLFLHWGDAAAAPCGAAYLALVFDYGLRFDRAMLLGATIAGASGFAAVAVTTPVWRAMPLADAMLLVAFAILPLYGAALVDRLARARRALSAAEAGQAQFLAILAHELRTPLNTIAGLSALLGRTRLETAQRDMVATLQLSARILIAVAREFLQPARGRKEDESFVLREALGDAAALMRPQAEARGFTLALVLDPRLPHICRGLKLELRQLVVNLLRQELDRAARRDIVLAANLAERAPGSVRVRLAVRAEGTACAPPPERLAGLFAEADAAPDESAIAASIAAALAAELGGTIAAPQDDAVTVELPLACDEEGVARPPDLRGHRVALVTQDRELAERLQATFAGWHGETQWYVEDEDALSVLGGGGHLVVIDGRRDPLAGLSLAHRFATAHQRPPILFIAPRQASEAVAGLAAAQLAAVIEEPVSDQDLASGLMSLLASAETESAATQAAASLHLLVADDSAANRETLKNLLERAGHRVEVASDGGAALAILDKGGFDVALLDLEMPGVSGDAVAKLHRLRHPGDEVPLVALVADAGAETAARCREAGFDAVVAKPADAAQLLAIISELRAARAARQRTSAPPGPEVTPISSHPRFLGDGEVVREATIELLRGLGGSDFLAEVVDTFRSDAARLIPRLREAAQRGELGPFSDLAHALRSGAANIGGVRLAQTLTALEDVSAAELRQAGAAYVEKIESELQRLETALEPFARKERRG